jgi:hypothetical protein
MINLELTEEQAAELKSLLDGSLGDMSVEIADTDNPRFRASLMQRRQQLTEVAGRLTRLIGAGETSTQTSPPAL